MRNLMLLSHAPIPRFVKRLQIAKKTGQTKVLYWDRKIENDIKFTIPSKVETESIPLVAPQGKPFKRSFILIVFCVRSIKRIIGYKPDTIHVGNLDMLFIAWLYKTMFNKDLKVIYEIGDLPEIALKESFFAKLFKKVEKILLKKVNILVLTSPYFWEKYYKTLTEKSKYYFIPNVPSQRIKNELNTTNEKNKTNKNNLIIGYIGSVRYEKQITMLMDCLQHYPDVKLVIAGGGKSLDKLKDYSKNMENVELLGPYDYQEISGLYDQIDLVFSVYDTSKNNVKYALPNRLYEAIMFQKPIIVSKKTALEKFTIDNNIGYAISDNNPTDLIELINYLLENREDIELKRKNMNKINSKYIYEHYEPIIESFYKNDFNKAK